MNLEEDNMKMHILVDLLSAIFAAIFVVVSYYQWLSALLWSQLIFAKINDQKVIKTDFGLHFSLWILWLFNYLKSLYYNKV